MLGQISLNNFFQSVRFDNPRLADQIEMDIAVVSMWGLSKDKTGALESVDRLRRVAFDLPVIQARVLENALTELGY
jgi:hypothetical protein